MDLEGQCLEIKNNSSENVCLSGWKLTNKSQTKTLQLPSNRSLKPGHRIRVVIGRNVKPGQDDVHWEGDVWNGNDTDQARLFDPDDQLKSLVDI